MEDRNKAVDRRITRPLLYIPFVIATFLYGFVYVFFLTRFDWQHLRLTNIFLNPIPAVFFIAFTVGLLVLLVTFRGVMRSRRWAFFVGIAFGLLFIRAGIANMGFEAAKISMSLFKATCGIMLMAGLVLNRKRFFSKTEKDGDQQIPPIHDHEDTPAEASRSHADVP